MNREKNSKQIVKQHAARLSIAHHVTQRLDESLPLQTDEWLRVEQLLMQITEFAPNTLVSDLVNSIALYADDQARRGYILGQEDLAQELHHKVA